MTMSYLGSKQQANSKQQRDLELLDRLTTAILMLKLESPSAMAADHRVGPVDFDARSHLVRLLVELDRYVMSMDDLPLGNDVDNPLAGMARRFIQVNPSDVQDRLDQLRRLRDRLAHRTHPLRDQDFVSLDELQALLEEETAGGVRSIYRF